MVCDQVQAKSLLNTKHRDTILIVSLAWFLHPTNGTSGADASLLLLVLNLLCLVHFFASLFSFSFALWLKSASEVQQVRELLQCIGHHKGGGANRGTDEFTKRDRWTDGQMEREQT